MACKNVIVFISLGCIFTCSCSNGESKQHTNTHHLSKNIPIKQSVDKETTQPSQTEKATVTNKPIEKPMISSITNGLSKEHQSQQPILDRISTYRHGQQEGVRTYKDGTQYMILIVPSDPNTTEKPPTWTRFITVTPKGIDLVQTIIKTELITHQSTLSGKSPTGSTGTITWVSFVEGKEYVIQTFGGNYNVLPSFVRKLDEATNQNVQFKQ